MPLKAQTTSRCTCCSSASAASRAKPGEARKKHSGHPASTSETTHAPPAPDAAPSPAWFVAPSVLASPSRNRPVAAKLGRLRTIAHRGKTIDVKGVVVVGTDSVVGGGRHLRQKNGKRPNRNQRGQSPPVGIMYVYMHTYTYIYIYIYI